MRPPRDVAALAASFANDTAQGTRRAGRTVQRNAQVGRLLGEPTLDVIERTPLANNRVELLKLARTEPVRRNIVLCEVERGGHAKVSNAEAALTKAGRQDELSRRAEAHQ